ncbi:hypothetical protein ACFPJ4_12625 [Lysinimonas soli]|uniref:Universal stress protein n=1 Tax=Lysinimonas soli TaxID=1074233 RepID=A0ABW0NRA4_9MICO
MSSSASDSWSVTSPTVEVTPARRYWVAVDDSPATDAAFEWALHRAQLRSAPLGLIVLDDDGASDDQNRDEAVDRLARRASAVNHEIEVCPGTSLVEVLPDDLLIVGVPAGEQGRERGMRLAALAACSVAVIPEDYVTTGFGVVCGVDHLENTAMIAAVAAEEAEQLDEPLLIIHAVPKSRAPFAAPGSLDPAIRVARDAVRAVSERLRVSSRLSTHEPVAALIEGAAHAAMLVVGGERVTSAGTVLGTLVRTTSVPLLIARNEGAAELSR